jgi:hypothetical protein
VWVALGGMIVYGGMRARIPVLTWLLLFAIAISPSPTITRCAP